MELVLTVALAATAIVAVFGWSLAVKESRCGVSLKRVLNDLEKEKSYSALLSEQNHGLIRQIHCANLERDAAKHELERVAMLY